MQWLSKAAFPNLSGLMALRARGERGHFCMNGAVTASARHSHKSGYECLRLSFMQVGLQQPAAHPSGSARARVFCSCEQSCWCTCAHLPLAQLSFERAAAQ